MKKRLHEALPDPEDVEAPPLLTHEERLRGMKLMMLKFGVPDLPFPPDTQDPKQIAAILEHLWFFGGSGTKKWGLATVFVLYRQTLFAIEGDKPEKPE